MRCQGVRVIPPKTLVEKPRMVPPGECGLCYGYHADGPRKGQRFPPCLACREMAREASPTGDWRMGVALRLVRA